VGMSDGPPVGVAGRAPTDMGPVVGVWVGVVFSASPPDGVAAPGPAGPGVALGGGGGPVPEFAAAAFPDASAGVGAAGVSCGVDVAVGVGVAVSGAVGRSVGRPAAMLGGCATGAGTVVVADGAATTVIGPLAKDGVTRLGVTVGDGADPPVAGASAMAAGGPSCGPRPAALVSPLTMVGEPGGVTRPCATLLGPTTTFTLAPVVA
jgi:hypothetical protein